MSRMWLQVLGIGVVLTAPSAAQSPDSTTSREVITAAGCVQPADGSGGSVGSGFVLRSARVTPAAGLLEALPAARPAAPGSDERQAAADADRDAAPADPLVTAADVQPRDPGLLLVADRGVDLAQHVGHRVLVTGRLSSFAAPGGVASAASGRTLTVSRLSLIAPACTSGS